ncbi:MULTISPECIES: helix-turn-helix domain-containing protein [unclassified Sphingomonas]|uniref:helix-turn-helix domain-containing protein n=1 Tax=unclassified Sphingomonas TaxID=196159 RepID=UPI00070097B6|nr:MULTISPECIES: helix-turn-helix transcriptional regulator [unclassified Sphingomonas]KQX25936.1 XRE family transcriptional regulator [Sphingomonas sp. Root1294]KQY69001.1 XRE family transcriptional regulator [Sphingomonas sp. Root50]KRB89257.1 XRE family transcriptional regulator [Sphingomonas sp. Root720]
MKSCIRDVRHAKGMTLQDVAERCVPPTTAQTIGRLETGTRTVSIGWLNRIAAALGAEAAELVRVPEQATLDILALLGPDGATAPRHPQMAALPRPSHSGLTMFVEASVGEYRAGDMIWLERLELRSFVQALNRDVLAPRAGGRFAFGRLIDHNGNRLQILPPGQGSRQQIVDAPWIAVAVQLLRPLH